MTWRSHFARKATTQEGQNVTLAEPMTEALVDLLTCGALDAAANWWAEQLLTSLRPSSGEVWHDLLAAQASRAERPDAPIGERHVREFRWALKAALAANLCATWPADPKPSDDQYYQIRCDYGPDWVLELALAAAKIHSGTMRLPIKTRMWIGPNRVTVRSGYGADSALIWLRTSKPESGT